MNQWGGKREGAGRKPVYDEPTVMKRVPISLVEEFKSWLESKLKQKDGKG